MLHFLPIREAGIVLAIAALIFGPRTLWQMRHGNFNRKRTR